ncbi:MAG: KH domain-containing protein [Anaerolineales bacterium]|nr:KH domain-containing protein [Anaerolineales bacterium]
MKEFVEFVVKSIVDHPDQVVVTAVEDRGTTVLELQVAGPDMGRVIGKGGRVINAIRALVQVQATKLDRQISLEIIED